MLSLFSELPKEILSNFSFITERLPLAKVTINKTCKLVVVTRIRYETVEVPTEKSYFYAKSFGDESDLKITFPQGAVEEKCYLRVKVILIFNCLNTF